MQWLIKLLVMLSWTLFAVHADIIVLHNGNRLEGKILSKGDVYRLELPYGTMSIASKDIKKIIYAKTNLDEYAQRQKEIADNDAEAHYQLYLWCNNNDLPKQAQRHLQLTLTIDPNHQKARNDLGYEYYEGRWVTHDKAMQLRGYVKHDNKWLSMPEYQVQMLRELQLQLATERKLRLAAEVRIAELEAEQANIIENITQLYQRLEDVEKEVAKPRYIIKKYQHIHPKPKPQNEDKDP